jgi:hypothetical protein
VERVRLSSGKIIDNEVKILVVARQGGDIGWLDPRLRYSFRLLECPTRPSRVENLSFVTS